ncbi:Gfo/Idh/MocA family protein [Litoribacter populi]|uniref:Gfo/Idh/MocA family protein n=1 Tax=Litoribacter populi TaxID=2598460 RepID=UPI001F212F1D|nr:Gfo/Idh/MocA family oxidoreductase [Litoribacter populi]
MKRREFIKAGAMLSAASVIAVPWASGLTIDGKVYKVGIIGYGDRGSGLHRILGEMPEKFQVVGICDNLDFRLEDAKKAHSGKSIKYYKDYRELVEQKDLDIVVVSTPLSFHYNHAKAALQAG